MALTPIVQVGDWAYLQATVWSEAGFVVWGYVVERRQGRWRAHPPEIIAIS